MNGNLEFANSDLKEKEKEEFEKHAGFNQNNIKEHYDELSAHYEQVYLKAGWPDPRKSADLAHEHVEHTGKTVETATIFDMGCGTGLVGKYMTEFGYKFIDGVDAS